MGRRTNIFPVFAQQSIQRQLGLCTCVKQVIVFVIRRSDLFFIAVNILFYHHMRICAAGAKRIYATDPWAFIRLLRPTGIFCHNFQPPVFQVYLGIHLFKMEIARYGLVAYGQCELYKPGNSCRTFQVAYVRFHGAYEQWTMPLSPGEYIRKCPCLNGVAYRCTGAMRFYILHTVSVDAGFFIGILQHSRLRMHAWHGKPFFGKTI